MGASCSAGALGGWMASVDHPVNMLPRAKCGDVAGASEATYEGDEVVSGESMRRGLKGRLRTVCFVAALAKSNIDSAAGMITSEPFVFDSEASYNPFRLWAAMTMDNDSDTRERERHATILHALLKSVTLNNGKPTSIASRINEVDPIDGFRPIDVASPVAACFLVILSRPPTITGVEIDINPSLTHSPLHRLMNTVSARIVCEMIEFMRPESLDWTYAGGPTALHIACSRSRFPGYRSVAEKLIMQFPWVNPHHPCFTSTPITQPPDVLELLAVARTNWNTYRKHLFAAVGNHSSLSGVCTKGPQPHPLVQIVIDFVL